MKHKWVFFKQVKAERATGYADRCTFCNCIRLVRAANGKHWTSYMEENSKHWIRTAPVCIDKVNAEFDFQQKGATA